MKHKVIAVVGPTASGKSSLGIFLAQKLKGEIISADSRQVYKGLDIGTGKVTKKEMAGVPHHLLDIISPKKQFSVDDFVRLGNVAYSSILKNIRIPIIVGGTGLYVDMLLGRMSYPHIPPNKKLRKQLERLTTKQLFDQLKKLDPARAKNIDSKNPRRLVRAIEIAKAVLAATKKLRGPAARSVAEPVDVRGLGAGPQHTKPLVLYLGINPDTGTLKKNIQARLKSRLKQGMIAEAKRLHNPPAGGGLSYKRMEELGLEYRYMARLLQKKISKTEFETQLEQAIWQYAKRQRTWFKRNKEIKWVKNKTEALQLSKKFLGGTL
jgi:tRNA dimethylallyltransferase